MYTVSCSVPGIGSSTDQTPKQETLATERMDRRWTFHSYKMSHDGETTIVHRKDGFEVVKGTQKTMVKCDLMNVNPREFMFHPDSKRVLMWCPFDPVKRFKKIGLMDTSRLSGSEPWEVVYDPAAYHKVTGAPDDKEVVFPIPFGFEWSPKGEAFFVIEKLFYQQDPQREMETVILRIDLPGKKVTEIVKMSGVIDFFMPPVSRFEGGGGPSTKGYYIAFGHREGLYVVDPLGKKSRRISTLPAVNLHNIEWNPADGVDQLLLFFKQQVVAADGSTLSGVVLVHLDRVGRSTAEKPWQEQLYDRLDVHTLWYSPKGTYATWGTKEFVAFRKPTDSKDKTVVILCKNADGLLEVKGVNWHHSEKFLAITAGSRLFVYDVDKKETREVARFGEDDAKNFVAEPRWVGDKVVLSRFEDVVAEAREYREQPHIDVRKKR